MVREIKGPPENSIDTLAVHGMVPLGLKCGELDVVNDGDSFLDTILLTNKDIDRDDHKKMVEIGRGVAVENQVGGAVAINFIDWESKLSSLGKSVSFFEQTEVRVFRDLDYEPSSWGRIKGVQKSHNQVSPYFWQA